MKIRVASTKTFTAQVSVSIIIALAIAKLKKEVSNKEFREITSELTSIDKKMKLTLSECSVKIQKIAKKYKNAKNALYLGRGLISQLL